MENSEVLLKVNDLKTYFFVKRGIIKAVDGISFSLKKGDILGLVGESGCGKTITGLSLLKLIPHPPGKIVGGQILFEGKDLLKQNKEEMRKMRGKEITMIQQDPDNSLNPVFKIGNQVAEAIAVHQKISKKSLWEKAVDFLRLVKIPSPETRMHYYPMQMSGGMKQRVCGAISLSSQAKLLIADEPTTNLDVTTQMEYLKLLEEIQKKTNIAIIFITHDLGIVKRLCNRIAVMYAGKIVEMGQTADFFKKPLHPYTNALLSSLPEMTTNRQRLKSISGQPPDPLNFPKGCTFEPRCPSAREECSMNYPNEVVMDNKHRVRCWLWDQQ